MKPHLNDAKDTKRAKSPQEKRMGEMMMLTKCLNWEAEGWSNAEPKISQFMPPSPEKQDLETHYIFKMSVGLTGRLIEILHLKTLES